MPCLGHVLLARGFIAYWLVVENLERGDRHVVNTAIGVHKHVPKLPPLRRDAELAWTEVLLLEIRLHHIA